MIQKTLHKHVGLRAEGMILVSFVWILVGVGSLTGSQAPEIPSAWHTLIPLDWSAAIWIVTALLAIALAPSDKLSNIGLGLLTVAPMIRFSSYLASWIIEVIPGPPPGDPRGWFSALFYFVMLMWVLHLSRIPADVRAPLYGRKR